MRPDDVVELLDAKRGHFLLESGHHGDLWLALDRLFVRPARLKPFAAELGERLAAHGIDGVCGPLTGGAFIAQTVATIQDAGIEVMAGFIFGGDEDTIETAEAIASFAKATAIPSPAALGSGG